MLIYLGATLAMMSDIATTAQLSTNDARSSVGTGMYSIYPDTDTHFFSADLGKVYPMEMDDLVPELLKAIFRLSNYPVPDTLPKVHRVAHEKIEELACGKKCPALGAYRSGEGIYLDEVLAPETNVFARSVLLHELVHYVQDVSNKLADGGSCDRWYRSEKEAYGIQEKFLALVGSEHRVSYSTLFGYSALLSCEEHSR
jgi:hypothetical protein